MIKKIIPALAMIFMLIITATAALAQQQTPVADDIGDPAYGINIQELSLFQRFRLNLLSGSVQPFSVVGGATCSINPDKGGNYSPSSGITRACKTNEDHTGLVYQLFKVSQSGWQFIGEHRLAQGEKGCFDVEAGTNYHFDYYFCDSTTERSCSDSDGGKDFTTKGTVVFELEGDTTNIDDRCLSSGQLQEIYCDADDSVASESRLCACNNGRCTADVEAQELKITMQDLEITGGGDLSHNQKYTIRGKAFIAGTCSGCIIETGQGYYGQALSIITSSKGACGDDNTVGIKFDAENEWVEFALEDIATRKGSFGVEIAAYNGCFDERPDDFKKLDSLTYSLEVTSAPAEDENVPSERAVECFFCMDDSKLKGTYDSSCPRGTSEEDIECGSGAPEEASCSNNAGDSACSALPCPPGCKAEPNSKPIVKIPAQELRGLSGAEITAIVVIGILAIGIIVQIVRTRRRKK